MAVNFILAWILSIALASFVHHIWSKSKYLLPPGPKKLPLIGNLHLLGRQPHRSLWQLSQKYGPLMYLKLGSVPTIFVSSAEFAKEVLYTQDLNFCSRPTLTATNKITYNQSDVSFSSYGDHWRQTRKILQVDLFSTKRVESLHQVREEEVSLLIKKVTSSTPGPVNLSDLMAIYASNMICNVALGTKHRARDYVRGELHRYFEEGEEMFCSVFLSDYFPWIGKIIDRVSGMTSKLDRTVDELDALYEQIIREHLDAKSATPKHQDMLMYYSCT